MKLGIISDTHGNLASIRQAVAIVGEVDMWLHAGDYCIDGDFLREISAVPVVAVAGNCDGRSAPAKVDEFIEVGDKKIWLTHGHRYQVKYGFSDILYCGKQFDVDIIVYGHTHIPEKSTHDGILLFNPGSAGEIRGQGAGTCGVLELAANGGYTASLLQLGIY